MGGPGRGVPAATDRVASKGKGKGKGAGRGRGRGGGSSQKTSYDGASAGSGKQAPTRPLQELLDYLRECMNSLQGASFGSEEENLLAARAVEEMGGRTLAVACDQRGSKILEKLVAKGDLEAFGPLFGALIAGAAELAPNQYASHVLEAALLSWSDRFVRANAEPTQEKPPTEPLVTLCKALGEESGWGSLVDNACASHVVRALLLALGGYIPEPKGKGGKGARDGQLPQKRFQVPEEISACRREVAGALVEMVQGDCEVCLHAHTSPVLQLLLRILRDCKEFGAAADLIAAILGAAVGEPPNVEQCEALRRSAAGSRLLEAILDTASAETFGQLFRVYFKPRLRQLSSRRDGDFGAFLLQKLADGLRDSKDLPVLLGGLNLSKLAVASASWDSHNVVVKLLGACTRLRSCFTEVASKLFEALQIPLGDDEDVSNCWPALFTLESNMTVADLVIPPQGDYVRPTLRQLPQAGPQIVLELLRFPLEAVRPLHRGLPKLFANKDALRALALERNPARVLESALDSSTSTLPPNLRVRLMRSFRGLMADIAPDPIGGWVAAAVYKASLGDMKLRQRLAKEMLSIEESLRVNNFAVWKVCNLNQAKTKTGEWVERQQKAGKAKRFLDDIITDGRGAAAPAAKGTVAEAKRRKIEDAEIRKVEAEKAKAAAARKKAWSADPLVASLLPVPEA